MSLFQRGNFSLHSGGNSSWKIDCDALTHVDIETIAYLVSEMVPPFVSVAGIPRGGMRLAQALLPYRKEGVNRHLIVDDVFTTGSSMKRAREDYLKNRTMWDSDNIREVIGAVIFARSEIDRDGAMPSWVRALFHYQGMVS